MSEILRIEVFERGNRSCSCPEYVRRCAHAGEVRAWDIALRDSREEYSRRSGTAPVFEGDDVQCRRCGQPMRARPGVVGGVWVGFPDLEPNCWCNVPIRAAQGHRGSNAYDEAGELDIWFSALCEAAEIAINLKLLDWLEPA